VLLTRKQFKCMLDTMLPNSSFKLSDRKSSVWIPEEMVRGRVSQYFLMIPPVDDTRGQEFWNECKANASGPVRCYSSSEDEEWWGFTSKDDALWFLLRWGQ